jgi:adenosine kinase
MIDIPVVKAKQILDPTGCGDAFRAGLLFGIENQLDWPTIGRLGSLLGSTKIAAQGGQNHFFTIDALEQSFKEEFGYSMR